MSRQHRHPSSLQVLFCILSFGFGRTCLKALVGLYVVEMLCLLNERPIPSIVPLMYGRTIAPVSGSSRCCRTPWICDG